MPTQYKNWTAEQVIELLELYGSRPVSEIAKLLGKPLGGIYYILTKEKVNLRSSYWTDSEVSLLQKNYSTLSNAELREILKRSEDEIQFKAASLNLYKDEFWTEVEKNELEAMKLAGCTYKQMSEMLNKTESSIHTQLVAMNLTRKCKRWSEDELVTIKYMASTGQYTYADIAIEVGATPQQINGICAYRGWNKKIKHTTSRGEELLGNILSKVFTGYYIQPQFYIAHGQKIDFFIPALNLGWEYDGRQHSEFTPVFHKTQENFEHCKELDRIKEIKCEELGITLIRINFDEELSIDNISTKYNQTLAGKGSIELDKIKKNGGHYTESTLAFKQYQEYTKKKQKEKRQQYLTSDKYKEGLEKARKYRHERYRKLRELKTSK